MKYTIDYAGGNCPQQAWGNLEDGRSFYFRERHDYWVLRVSFEPQSSEYVEWDNKIAEGPFDYRNDDMLEIVHQYLRNLS